MAGQAGVACRRSVVAVPCVLPGSVWVLMAAAGACCGHGVWEVLPGAWTVPEGSMRACCCCGAATARPVYRAGIGLFLDGSVLGRSGSDLLSRVLRRSTIGARGFHGRVRDGIGCLPPAITTRSSKHAPLRFSHSKRSGTHLSSAACSGLSLFS